MSPSTSPIELVGEFCVLKKPPRNSAAAASNPELLAQEVTAILLTVTSNDTAVTAPGLGKVKPQIGYSSDVNGLFQRDVNERWTKPLRGMS